jgi:hypothetical protein
VVALVRSGTVNSPAGTAATEKVFAPPSLNNVVLSSRSISLLKSQQKDLRDSGYTQSLLAWSPLITLAGESTAGGAAISVASTDWQSLVEGMHAVNRLTLLKLAQESTNEAYANYSNPKARAFWQEMYQFYMDEVNKR